MVNIWPEFVNIIMAQDPVWLRLSFRHSLPVVESPHFFRRPLYTNHWFRAAERYRQFSLQSTLCRKFDSLAVQNVPLWKSSTVLITLIFTDVHWIPAGLVLVENIDFLRSYRTWLVSLFLLLKGLSKIRLGCVSQLGILGLLRLGVQYTEYNLFVSGPLHLFSWL